MRLILTIIYASLHVITYFTSCQNVLDTHYPILISDQFKLFSRLSGTPSHFGFSVTLVRPFLNQTSTNGYPQSWLLIGAPKGTSNDPTYPASLTETGVIWRCSLGARSSETCEIFHLDPIPDESKGQCSWRTCNDFPVNESRNQSWVGGQLASVIGTDASKVAETGRFVTCAHRWARGKGQYMNGHCYFFNLQDINQLQTSDTGNFMKDKINLRTYQHRLTPLFEKHEVQRNQYFKMTKDKPSSAPVRNGHENNGIKWAIGQAGTSFHAFNIRDSNNTELVIGAPGVYIWAGAVIRYQDRSPGTAGRAGLAGALERQNAYGSDQFRRYVIATRSNSDVQNWYSYFGYAVTSGYYNISTTNQLLYVAGAPRSNFLQGEVVVFDLKDANDEAIEEKLVLKPPSGNDNDMDKQTGSYFGSVLLTVNFNGDTFDDLFVGAPLSSRHLSHSVHIDIFQPAEEGDEGCVFLYTIGKQFEGFSPPQMLIGETVPGSRFGSAIVNVGDLNGDGLNDVAIGAPYQNEGTGVVYIYLGRRDSANQVIDWNQKIVASDFKTVSLRGFGVSISNAIDIDGNQTPDLAIGSYESDQVVVLRTRPSIKVNARVTYELFDGEQRKSFSVLPKTQKVFVIKACVQFTAKFGRPSDSIALKTILAVDERYQRFSLTQVSRFPPSTRLSNTSFEYMETLITGADYACSNFEASRLNDYPDHMSDNIPPIKIDVRVIQESQYKDTDDTLIRHHRITTGRPSSISRVTRQNVPAVEVPNGQPAFDDFCAQCTYRTQNQFAFSLPVSNCIDRDCKPDMKIHGGFLKDGISIQSGFIDKFIIGSSRRLVLFVTIKNDGDTAIAPRLDIKWSKAGLRTITRPLECPDEPIKMIGSEESILTCNIGDVLRGQRNKTLQIVFDVRKIFARGLEEALHIDTEVSSTKDNNYNSDSSHRFTLPLISDPDLKVNVRASAAKEIYHLSSLFDHSYEVYIQGKSPVSFLSMKFKIPFYADVNGQVQQIARFLRFTQPRQGTKINCEVPKEALTPETEVSGHGYPPPVVALPPSKGDVDGGNFDYTDENIMPTEELDIPARRRRAAEGHIASSFLTKKKELLPPPQKDTLLLECDDETSSLKTECIEVRCTADDVPPYPAILVFVFSMALMNTTAKELLDSQRKTSILFRSHAMAEAIGIRNSDSDSGQTLIHTIQQSVSVSGWVYIVAAVVGCCVLALIIFVLHRIGFFRREKKEQLDEMKQEVLRQSLRSRIGSIPQVQGQMGAHDEVEEDLSREHSLSRSSQEDVLTEEESKGVAQTKL